MLPVLHAREDLFNHWVDSFLNGEEVSKSWPKTDLHEDDKNFYLKADLPGFDTQDIQIQVKDNVLSLRGKRQEERKNEKNHYYRYERFQGSFERSFYLPDNVDSSQIEAEMKNGVIQLIIPKKAESQAKEIEIQIK